MSIDGVVLRLDPDLPVLTCTVIQTSGDPRRDDQACRTARERTGTPSPEMSFQPDSNGQFVSCSPIEGGADTPEFRARCAANLERMQRMRAMLPIEDSRWLRPSDIYRLPIPAGTAVIRVGINIEGRPFYCILVEPREIARLERALCSRMMERARFWPARDLDGRPMPSTY
jgi:hypothetical protein